MVRRGSSCTRTKSGLLPASCVASSSDEPCRAEGAEQAIEPAHSFGALQGHLLEQVAAHLDFKQRVDLARVNRHWRDVVRGSLTLWHATKLDVSGADGEHVGQVLAWVASRAQGIRELDLSFDGAEQWPDLACMLGMLRPSLRRCCITGGDGTCELCVDSGAFLYTLGGLTSLDLDNCIGTLGAGVSQLTGLHELLVSREDGPTYSEGFTVPSQISALHHLTRLELVKCVSELPAQLCQLSRLRLLNLEGSDFFESAESLELVLRSLTSLEELDLGNCNLGDLPSAVSALTGLTTLSLDHAFGPHTWGAAAWETKLAGLSRLQRLMYLELSENDLSAIPQSVTDLRCLETIKMGLNPVGQSGLPNGPYLESLLHLDLRGARFVTLPQRLTRAQRLQFLGLSCCHDLLIDRPMVHEVLGRLSCLEVLTLCGQQMQTVDVARAMLTLGRMLPKLEVSNHDDLDDEHVEDDDDDVGDGDVEADVVGVHDGEDDEEDSESESGTDEDVDEDLGGDADGGVVDDDESALSSDSEDDVWEEFHGAAAGGAAGGVAAGGAAGGVADAEAGGANAGGGDGDGGADASGASS